MTQEILEQRSCQAISCPCSVGLPAPQPGQQLWGSLAPIRRVGPARQLRASRKTWKVFSKKVP